jgi:Xaa-Pro aminopeptidase
MSALRNRQAYRPKDGALLLSTPPQARSAGLVTPPVPKAAQPAEAAASATPANPASRGAAPNLATTNATSSQTSGQSSVPSSGSNASTPSTGYESLFAAAQRNEASLFLLIPPGEGESREYKQEQRFAAQWKQDAKGFALHNGLPIFAELRMRKSPLELRLLQHAIDITTEGFGRAMAVVNRAQWEYEVEAEIDYTFKRRNADNWGYPSIVGCGPNATTLHYETSQGRVAQGDLLLMDVGAEYDHYTADVTRTYPVNGKFTAAQTDIYQIVPPRSEALRCTQRGARSRQRRAAPPGADH